VHALHVSKTASVEIQAHSSPEAASKQCADAVTCVHELVAVASALQATVPRETQLVITVQRASNLPRRIAAGGGGVRAKSPNRMTGEKKYSGEGWAHSRSWRRSGHILGI
jgi:hypothetical protein